MSYTERLARLVYGLLWLAIALAAAALGWYGLHRPPADPATGAAGLSVETDAGTGCQYVVTPWGGIFVRLDRDGKPMCGGAERGTGAGAP